MLELTSADRVTVNGKLIYTFHGIEGLDPRKLNGDFVMIDGLRMLVGGVETFSVMDATGMNFGLMAFPVGGFAEPRK